MTRFTFDTTDCRRCGGSGHYSYNRMTGTRCFRCAGRGVELTKAADRAKQTLDEWHTGTASVRVDELTVGQPIRFKLRTKLRRITSINRESGAASIVDGERIPLWAITVEGSEVIHQMRPDALVIRQLTEDEQRERDELLRSLQGVTEHETA